MRYELSFLCFQIKVSQKIFGPEKISIISRKQKEDQKSTGNAKIHESIFWKFWQCLISELSKWVNIYQICHHLNSSAFLELCNCSSAFFRAELFSKPMRDNILITRCYLGLSFTTYRGLCDFCVCKNYIKTLDNKKLQVEIFYAI